MKLMQGLSEKECREFIEKRKQNLYSLDFKKYGSNSDLVLNYRIYAIQQFEKEVNKYFKI